MLIKHFEIWNSQTQLTELKCYRNQYMVYYRPVYANYKMRARVAWCVSYCNDAPFSKQSTDRRDGFCEDWRILYKPELWRWQTRIHATEANHEPCRKANWPCKPCTKIKSHPVGAGHHRMLNFSGGSPVHTIDVRENWRRMWLLHKRRSVCKEVHVAETTSKNLFRPRWNKVNVCIGYICDTKCFVLFQYIFCWKWRPLAKVIVLCSCLSTPRCINKKKLGVTLR